jgi:hypothetical protein
MHIPIRIGEKPNMKLSKMALAAAIASSVLAGTASAQGLRQPASFVQETPSYYTRSLQPSPSDAPPAQPAAPAVEMAAPCDACDACAEEEEEECLPWRLFNQDTCSGWKAYGFVNAGWFLNSHGTASRYNGPVTFADRSDGQVNQLYGILEKTIDTSENCWDFGGRLDVLYGTDWIYNTEVGWETDQTGALLSGWNSNPYYGLVTTQLYGEIGYNNLSVKLGRFYTPIGYEVVPANMNFFPTHAYTMQYGEPFSHSGALATWKPGGSENWTLIGGLVNGWDRFDGLSDRIGGIGGVIYTPDHGEYTITLTGISGSDPTFADPTLFTTRSLYSLVFNWNVTDNLNYVFQHDNGWQDNSLGGGQDAEWYGINQYLFYTINECWKTGLRAEWFRDDDGVRVAGIRPTDGADLGNDVATGGGFAGHFFEVAAGLNWTPHANLIVRPEIRYDWYDGVGNPFGDQTSQSQWVGGLDAVLLW